MHLFAYNAWSLSRIWLWVETPGCTEFQEEVPVKYILDKDDRGCGINLAGVDDMANLLLESRRASHVGILWVHQFVQQKPELRVNSLAPITSRKLYAKILLLRGFDFLRI